jgi:transcriptional regulator with XRE-family HTH domain
MMAKKKEEDPVMAKVRALFKQTGLTLHEMGLKMGYPPETARQSVYQLVRVSDPHISVLRKFAEAVGITIEELVGKTRMN